MASASSTAASCSAFHAGGRQQARQAVVQFVLAEHAARGVQARQQRMDAGLLQRPGGARRNVAGDDFHSDSSTAAALLAAEQAAERGAAARRPAGCDQVRALRSPHSVSVTASPRVQRLPAGGRIPCASSCCHAAAQARQSPSSAASRR